MAEPSSVYESLNWCKILNLLHSGAFPRTRLVRIVREVIVVIAYRSSLAEQ
jgi:hypothetical protein